MKRFFISCLSLLGMIILAIAFVHLGSFKALADDNCQGNEEKGICQQPEQSAVQELNEAVAALQNVKDFIQEVPTATTSTLIKEFPNQFEDAGDSVVKAYNSVGLAIINYGIVNASKVIEMNQAYQSVISSLVIAASAYVQYIVAPTGQYIKADGTSTTFSNVHVANCALFGTDTSTTPPTDCSDVAGIIGIKGIVGVIPISQAAIDNTNTFIQSCIEFKTPPGPDSTCTTRIT